MAETKTNREGGTTVYVDDQPVTVDEAEVSIRRLLELAGTPTDTAGGGEAVLRELRGGQEIKHETLEETITVLEDARFYTRGASAGTGRSEGSFKSESGNLETGSTPKTGGNVNTSTFGGGGEGGSRTGGNREPGSQRSATEGSNVASGTDVRRETESPERGTIPGQGVQNMKTGGQQGSAVQGSKPAAAEQARQGFNEGQGQQEGARRSGERTEGRPGERKKEEQKT
ncbi:MAG TPA: hypothetical protein VGB18_02320 [Candidatus Thermoplasmatota archaeon]